MEQVDVRPDFGDFIASGIKDEYENFYKSTKWNIFMKLSISNCISEFYGTFAFVYFSNWCYT